MAELSGVLGARAKPLPDPADYEALKSWLEEHPPGWAVVLAARAALRVLPLAQLIGISTIFRATAVAQFVARYPSTALQSEGSLAAVNDAYISAYAAASAADEAPHAAFAAADAAFAAGVEIAVATSAADAINNAAKAARTARAYRAVVAAVKYDARLLLDQRWSPAKVASAPLWNELPPPRVDQEWQGIVQRLSARGGHWSIWIDWYNDVCAGALTSVAKDAAFTDIPGRLPWDRGAEAVNAEITQRLANLSLGAQSPDIPDQSLAPVRVEERDGRVAKMSERDSALSVTERDFKAWRDPVVDHIDELTASDFAAGTNHSRVRDRLMALGKLLPGEIAEVKEQQFRIGYEIERFDGLMAAYRSDGEDMPMLNAAQLEDLDRLRVALKMGIDKLERWSDFRRQANESAGGEADADRQTVGDALDEMAAAMEQRSQYFAPELPVSFRFLAEAVRDPSGASRAIVYGAVKSAENLVSFLGQKALGIGKKGVEAVEAHISKAVATLLIGGLSSAALGLSFGLPQGWTWLRPLLTALGVGGG